jgi:SAM-dependent methyltransferase
MKEAKRILKPDGIFIATSPVAFWDKLVNKIIAKNKFRDSNHVTDISKDSLYRLSEESGFKIIRYFYFMWAPIGFLPYLKIPVSASLAWKIDRFLNKFPFLNWSFVNQCLVARNNH